MLSYRHAFHAGNHADVLKHAILIHCLQHFLKKDKPFHYVDTHAGAGLYELTTGYADQNREFEGGIQKLLNSPTALPQVLQAYVDMVLSFNPTTQLEFYPGSPLIARQLMRSHDQLRLHELHQADHDILYTHVASDPRILLQKKEGLRGLIKAFPPPSRRGIALIDPPYENKQDYAVLAYAIDDALFKFATGMILVWYPMLENGLFEPLKDDLSKVSGERWLNVELCIRRAGKGLYGSGMWVINPPWDLPTAIETMRLPLISLLGETVEASLELNFSIP